MKRNDEGAEVERVEDLGLTVQSSGVWERGREEQVGTDGGRLQV